MKSSPDTPPFDPFLASLPPAGEMDMTLTSTTGQTSLGGGMNAESSAESSSTFLTETPQGGMSGERTAAPNRKGGAIFHVKVSCFRTSAEAEERMRNPMSPADTREVYKKGRA